MTDRKSLLNLLDRITTVEVNPLSSDRLKNLHVTFCDLRASASVILDEQLRQTAHNLLVRLSDEYTPFFGTKNDISHNDVRDEIFKLVRRN